jgi:hypothetical protein
MAWRDGADSVHLFLDMLEQRNARYREWSPRLRAFAEECRRLWPFPSDESLSRCDQEKQRIYESKLETPQLLRDVSVALCRMPLIAMPVARRLWVMDDERVVLLTPDEESGWNEICERREREWRWITHHWWDVDDSPQQAPSGSPFGHHWNAQDVPNGENPWIVTVGCSYGPTFGWGDKELWSWNGQRAQFIKGLSWWIS